jgi:hypothetical protein
VAQTFWIGVGAAIIATIAAAMMQEHALRTSDAPVRAATSPTDVTKRPAVTTE